MTVEERLDNASNMAVRCVTMDDADAREVVVVIAKATYRIDGAGRISVPAQRPVRVTDTPTTRGEWSSVKYPGEWVDRKVGTDVVVVGTAYPRARGATHADVSIRIETGHRTLQRALRVYGPRVYQPTTFGVAPGPPGPMVPTPVVYELAYGGADTAGEGEALVEWRNPAGVGVARDVRSLIGTRAPQVEDPEGPLDSGRPLPAGLGAVQSWWQPRAAFAGTRDDKWWRERSPALPRDFDLRFHSVASPGLWSERPLTGHEPCEVVGLVPEGVLRFQLPPRAPIVTTSVGGEAGSLRPVLDTWLFDLDERVVELTWRASFVAPKKLAKVQRVSVEALPALPASVQRVG